MKVKLFIGIALLLLVSTGCTESVTPFPTSTPSPTPAPSPDDWQRWRSQLPAPQLQVFTEALCSSRNIPLRISAPSSTIDLLFVNGTPVVTGAGEEWSGTVPVPEDGGYEFRVLARREVVAEDPGLTQYGPVVQEVEQRISVFVDSTPPQVFPNEPIPLQAGMLVTGEVKDNGVGVESVSSLNQAAELQNEQFKLLLPWRDISIFATVPLAARDRLGNERTVSVPVVLPPNRAERYDGYGFLLEMVTAPGFWPGQLQTNFDNSRWLIYRDSILTDEVRPDWSPWLTAALAVVSYGGLVLLGFLAWRIRTAVEKRRREDELQRKEEEIREQEIETQLLQLKLAQAALSYMLARAPQQDLQEFLLAARQNCQGAKDRAVLNGCWQEVRPGSSLESLEGLFASVEDKETRDILAGIFQRTAQQSAVITAREEAR